MIDTSLLLDDIKFAKEMLKKDKFSNSDMVFILRNIYKFKYYPVAVKYFYKDEEIEEFKKNNDYEIALKPLTFCHYVAASRQEGHILFSEKDKLGCSNAKFVLGWKEFDDSEIKGHLKYTKNKEQAIRFVKTKKRLEPGLKAFATAPLHKANFEPDVIHMICDVLQSYHIGNDWDAAFDTHPFEMIMTMNSSVCHGCVYTYVTQKPNITQMCSGSYTSGKTEQGEINVIMPYSHLEPTLKWTLERIIRDGGASYPRTGHTYPGYDVCKLCPFLIFKKGKK